MSNNPDQNIKQDFHGFPHPPSSKKQIHPVTDTDKVIATVGVKDGEKRNKDEIDESKSDGSGGAFEATEEVKE